MVTITICFWLCLSGYHHNLFLIMFKWLPLQFVSGYVWVVTITICFWLCLSGYHYSSILIMFKWLPLQLNLFANQWSSLSEMSMPVEICHPVKFLRSKVPNNFKVDFLNTERYNEKEESNAHFCHLLLPSLVCAMCWILILFTGLLQ